MTSDFRRSSRVLLEAREGSHLWSITGGSGSPLPLTVCCREQAKGRPADGTWTGDRPPARSVRLRFGVIGLKACGRGAQIKKPYIDMARRQETL
jgi:hypothetical protein